ncbi:MAG: NFACT RNA binding domain-containing protein [Pseudomonadota bacterium]|nr:NFACT RNA binding domain-containing protein [Pseudomonadota bacterium]
MDEQSLKIMTTALAETLSGTFITKVHQMTPYHLLLRLRGGGQGGERRLLISVAPMEPGLHLTSRRYLNPPRPLRFCAYLRHHLQGAKISTIEKVDDDRIIIIRAARREAEEKQLIIELTGKRSNAALCRGSEMEIGARMFESPTDQRLKPGNKYQQPETAGSTSAKPPSFLLAEIIGQEEIADFSSKELQSGYDDWFFPRYRSHYGNREIKRLEKGLRQHRRRLQKRIKRLNVESNEKKSHLNDSHLGDLLKGALHQIKRGAKSIKLTNYWSPSLEEVEIILNPAISPLANLEKFYKNAKKAKRGLKLIEKRLIETRHEEDYTEELLFQFEELTNTPDRSVTDEEQDLLELASDLAEKKSRQKTPEKSHKRKKSESKPKSSRHSGVERKTGVDGGIIYVGLNALGNENIYRHLSAPEDLWFHTLNRPGAHILLKTAPGSISSEKEQLQAATLAAANSRGKNEKLVEVTMIQIKHLRKPKGGRPGQVLLSGPRQTLTVNPKESDQESIND